MKTATRSRPKRGGRFSSTRNPRSEFYAAKQAGDKIALVLEVRGSDYEGETWIEYGGNPYEVVRTYTRAGEVIELNCKEAPKPAEGAQDGGGEGAAV